MRFEILPHTESPWQVGLIYDVAGSFGPHSGSSALFGGEQSTGVANRFLFVLDNEQQIGVP